MSVSLCTSMLTRAPPLLRTVAPVLVLPALGPDAVRPDAVGPVPLPVCRDDRADEAVSDNVLGGEDGEVNVVEPVEDVADDAQAAEIPAGQVDLGHVPGHDHLGAEPEP